MSIEERFAIVKPQLLQYEEEEFGIADKGMEYADEIGLAYTTLGDSEEYAVQVNLCLKDMQIVCHVSDESGDTIIAIINLTEDELPYLYDIYLDFDYLICPAYDYIEDKEEE